MPISFVCHRTTKALQDKMYDAFPKLDFSTLRFSGLSRNAYPIVHLEAKRFQLGWKHQMTNEVIWIEQLEFLSSTEETSPIIGRLLCIDGRAPFAAYSNKTESKISANETLNH